MKLRLGSFTACIVNLDTNSLGTGWGFFLFQKREGQGGGLMSAREVARQDIHTPESVKVQR